jgi:hypothetical protein
MTKYEWKNEATKMLRMLRNSRALKIKHGWSREMGAGFIKDDIKSMKLNADNTITITFHFDHIQTFKTSDLNLRETEEAIKYLKKMP